MNNLIPLDFSSSDVRMIMRDDEPWWVLNDVCKVLEIANPRNVAKRLRVWQKDDVHTMDAIGREQHTTIINEAGLYKIVLNSRKAIAEEFERWLTCDVLPSIRKYGSYPAPQAISYVDEPISNHEQTTLPQRFKQERLRWEAAENLSLANIPSMSKSIITAIESGMGGMTKGKRMQYMLYAGVDVLYIMSGRRTLTTAERAVRDAMRGGDDDVRAMLYARALQITN